MKFFLTGGMGYIGSHILVRLLTTGHDICVFDNGTACHPNIEDQLQQITKKPYQFIKADLLDEDILISTLKEYRPDVVIHCAGLKSIAESNAQPLLYYRNNVMGTIMLLSAMEKAGCSHLIFSSSATVYGAPEKALLTESHTTVPLHAYGRTKLMIEDLVRDWVQAHGTASIILRYFNPAGAHKSGAIGESFAKLPNNLMPLLGMVAAGFRERLDIFGNDYDTIDGTGVRDYIHVEDLADVHVLVADYLMQNKMFEIFNVGTGTGCSVLQMIDAYEKASNKKITYNFCARRKGDAAIVVADSTKLNKTLNWTAKYTLQHMCEDSWRWVSQSKTFDN